MVDLPIVTAGPFDLKSKLTGGAIRVQSRISVPLLGRRRNGFPRRSALLGTDKQCRVISREVHSAIEPVKRALLASKQWHNPSSLAIKHHDSRLIAPAY